MPEQDLKFDVAPVSIISGREGASENHLYLPTSIHLPRNLARSLAFSLYVFFFILVLNFYFRSIFQLLFFPFFLYFNYIFSYLTLNFEGILKLIGSTTSRKG